MPANTATATATATATSDPTAAGPLVRIEVANHVATLTLNRPQQFNALSLALMTELIEAIRVAGDDDAVRVVVLAGAGKAFSAGHDLKELRAHPDTQAVRTIFETCSRLMLSVVRCPKPVIARVHGIATAAGCQLVASCDLAVAVDSARFAVSGVNLGLFCATPMVALTRNMPRKQAMEMLLTGDFIDAATALHYGLVNRVVAADALDAAVGELAGKIAAKSPVAIALGKQLFHRQLEAGWVAAYAMASETIACNMDTSDAQAGIDAFIAKQPMPEWQGR